MHGSLWKLTNIKRQDLLHLYNSAILFHRHHFDELTLVVDIKLCAFLLYILNLGLFRLILRLHQDTFELLFEYLLLVGGHLLVEHQCDLWKSC